MLMSVRVRYAPSPTGSPHVGNIRTALFCHLLAKNNGGVNTLRIEDTDRSRYVPGCEEEIIESLHWMGIEYQEGPIRQSERAEQGVYDEWVAKLLEMGHAYKAFDTSEELTEMREFQQINKQPIGYFGGVWRDADPSQVAEAEASGKKPVIRLKMPRGKTIVVNDAIRGRVEFESDTSDDPVLIKADGMPTYHCAAMIDDHLMGTTHIIRGEEWISSAPKHVWLFEAFGWTPPIFVHVTVIKGKDGAKLSKRHGDTKCLDFRAAGYLPEALANFIALIGWSPGGNQELMSMGELIANFSLDGLQPSPGVFDIDKLRWMNGHYIRALTPENFVDKVNIFLSASDTMPYWTATDPAVADDLGALAQAFESDPKYAARCVLLEQERVTTLADLGSATRFFFDQMPTMDPKAKEKWLGETHVKNLLTFLLDKCRDHSDPTVEECEAWIRGFATENGFEKLGPVVHPTRVALTGRTVGPGLFELMNVLGSSRMATRLEQVLGELS